MANVTVSLLPQTRPGFAPAYKWFLGLVMLAVVSLGWRYPLLGFVVPVAMLTGMIGGLFRGRYVCGNICPRGSFFDTYFRLLSPRRPVPGWMLGMPFRWLVLVGLMGFMVWRLAANPGSVEHWGLVFWSMCALTTAVGVVFGLFYRPRTWCSFCPVGTLQNLTGGDKMPLQISAACKGCAVCEKSCPMDLSIAVHSETGVLPHRDCLKCSSCAVACPTGALSWDKAA